MKQINKSVSLSLRVLWQKLFTSFLLQIDIPLHAVHLGGAVPAAAPVDSQGAALHHRHTLPHTRRIPTQVSNQPTVSNVYLQSYVVGIYRTI